MKIIKSPHPDILISRYRKKRLFAFNKFYEPQQGYLMMMVDPSGRIESSVGGEVENSDTIYSLKKTFEFTWGIGKLPCFTNENELPVKLGINGKASFEVEESVKFFEKLEIGKAKKVYITTFKTKHWMPLWKTLLEETFADEKITRLEAPQFITGKLREAIDKKTLSVYGVSVKHITINSMT